MQKASRRRAARRVEAMPGSRLPVRLRRETPWAAQRGVAYFVGLTCTGVAGILALQMARHWPEVETSERWGVGLFVAVFGLVGLLALFSGVHQLLASLVAETIVEVDRLEVGRGEAVKVCFRQPGPVALRSLRATLVRKTIVSPSEEERRRSEHARDKDFYEFFQRFLDARDLSAPRGGTAEVVAELTIPRNARLSGQDGRERVQWLIEVWGRVRFWPGFMHQFEIVVTEPRRGKRG